MTTICTVSVKYSANLGDGVIAECLEHAMQRAAPGLRVEAIDLAGRRGFGDGLNRSRARLLSVLERLPQPLRRLLVAAMLHGLARLKLRPGWAEQLRGSDGVVLGGGQLLADSDLNFPIKIGACLGLAARGRLPVAVYGIGVGAGWSPAGRRLFRAAIATSDLRAFVARDGVSRRRAQAELGGVLACPVATCPDPAVLVHEAYGVPLHRPGGSTGRIGLCVAWPGVLRLHSDTGAPAMPVADLYAGIVRVLAERGQLPVCFTNGAGEDEGFLRGTLRPMLDRAGLLHRVEIAPRPAEPRDLVTLIAGLDAVVAHRLHASIIAYGLRVPHVGLNWDSKVRHFFAEVGREEFVVEPGDAQPGTVTARLDRALAEGIDPAGWQRTVDRSRASVEQLLDSLLRPARTGDATHWRQSLDPAA